MLREVNERLLDLAAGDEIELVCECGADECIARITIPIDDYRRLRRDLTLIVDTFHAERANGLVVEDHVRWSVVEIELDAIESV